MIEFNKRIQAKFSEMQKTGKLFRVALTGQQIWDLYLNSFPKEVNPVFRDPSSTQKNCNHCKNFIRRYGNVVSVDNDYNIVTMFDVDANEEYKNMAMAYHSLFQQYDGEVVSKAAEKYMLEEEKEIKRKC